MTQSPDAPSRSVDGKGILVDLKSGYYFSLNSTGRFIWEAIDGTRSVREIARRLAGSFDVEESIALTDCIELAERLAEDGLVTISD